MNRKRRGEKRRRMIFKGGRGATRAKGEEENK
jgi:hypothetical protein